MLCLRICMHNNAVTDLVVRWPKNLDSAFDFGTRGGRTQTRTIWDRGHERTNAKKQFNDTIGSKLLMQHRHMAFLRSKTSPQVTTCVFTSLKHTFSDTGIIIGTIKDTIIDSTSLNFANDSRYCLFRAFSEIFSFCNLQTPNKTQWHQYPVPQNCIST